MKAQRSPDVAARLRWGLIPLAVVIGLTAYVAMDDIALSFVFSAMLGLTALAAAWLLLRGTRGGSVLAGVSAAALLVVQVGDVNTLSLEWLRLSYIAIGALTLALAAAEVFASWWALLRRTPGERITP